MEWQWTLGALTRLAYGPDTYLYAARVFDPQFRQQIDRANAVMSDSMYLHVRKPRPNTR